MAGGENQVIESAPPMFSDEKINTVNQAVSFHCNIFGGIFDGI